ncbi:MAG: alanine racemase [Sulfurospirillum sp.]|nr:alanine racemase [Sulfurospirillum sp.]
MAFIEISKENYQHNIEYLAEKAGGKDKLMVVLKDNAYGHDLEIMAKLACGFGIKKSAVKTLKEAKKINFLFEEVLILADHPTRKLQTDSISYAVHSLEGLRKFPKKSCVHVNVDSGMHRNGISEDELKDAFIVILKNGLNLKGIFTHFRSADQLSSEQYWQNENFNKIKKQAKKLILKYKLPMPKFHSCNSSSLLRREEPLEDDFARCGISTYGYTHIHESFGEFDLKPVMSLWAQKLSTRNLNRGERVGYGGVYELLKNDMVSTYDIGYGDGFFRHDGQNELILEGKNVCGRVSMDSMCFLGDAKKVCLFKDAYYLAKKFNTITYDIIVKLSPYIKKVVV